jgi:hypothetical protein
MTVRDRCLRLEGLEPDNLLAFVALLGLLRALEASSRSSWRPRVAWDVDSAPLRPVLNLVEPQTPEAVCEAAAEGATAIAADYYFPQGLENDAPQKDLNYSAETARQLIRHAAVAENRRYAYLFGAIMCDTA